MGRARLARSLPWLGAALLLAVLASRALAAASRGVDVLGAAAPWVGQAIEAAGALDTGSARVLARLGPVASGLVAAGFAWAWIRRRPIPPLLRTLGALLMAWTGHVLLVEARAAAGALLYVAAFAAYCVRAGPPSPLARQLPTRLELPLVLALLAAFLLLALYRLDVYPPLYFDEAAYAMAARIGAGDVEPQPLRLPDLPAGAYTFERIRAQAVPFLLQSATAAIWPAGILPLRLLSVATSLLTLAIASLAVRAALGAPIALGMLALGCTSTLVFGYGRPAFYLAFSPLHAAACLATGLRFARRADAASALGLGILFGSAAYFYQISWFAPLLTATAVVAAWPRLPAPRRQLGLALLAALGAGAALLTGVPVLRDGLRQVVEQTADGAAWPPSELEGVQLTKAAATPADAMRGLSDANSLAIAVRLRIRPGDTLALRIWAPVETLDPIVTRLRADGWRLEWRRPSQVRWLQNAVELSDLLFVAPSQESLDYWIGAPLLGPGPAALLFLGILEALRRRRDPMLRALLVWVIGAAFLPGIVADALPRRAILLQPFGFALAVLPLVAAMSGPGAATRARRSLAAGGVTGALLLAAASGVHAYFAHWYWQPGASTESRAGPLSDARALDFVAWVNRAHADRLVLIPPVLEHTRFHLDLLQPDARPSPVQRIFFRPRARSAETVRRASCRFPTPLSWITRDDQRFLFEGLEREFAVEIETRERLLRVRLARRLPGACPDASSPAKAG